MFGSAAGGEVRAKRATVAAVLLVAALAAGVAAVVLAGPAWAATLTVETASDEQNANELCSLREAVINANQNNQSDSAGSQDCPAGVGADRIDFGSSLSGQTITLAGPLPTVTDDEVLTVAGGADSDVTISGNNAVRVFEVAEGATLALRRLTVAEGNGGPGSGGGIHNQGTLRVTGSTLSDNSAPSGGIEHAGGSATLRNTIVADSTLGGDCHKATAAITDGGYNLDSDDSCDLRAASSRPGEANPGLGPLADNGGPTQTHALAEDSPAVDRGRSFGVGADQRGLPRPTDLGPVTNAPGGDGSDIGAYDQLRCSGGVVNAAGTIVGGAGPDRLSGGPGDDFIFGLGGNDTIFSGGGNDEVCSGKGNDRIEGEGGDDTLLGGRARTG